MVADTDGARDSGAVIDREQPAGTHDGGLMTVYWVTLKLDGGALDVYAFTTRAEAERFALRYGAKVVEDVAYESADEALLDRRQAEQQFGFTPERLH